MRVGQGRGSEKSALRYQEIEAWLREIILTGRPGQALPSEVEIAANFDVSRMTARQAVFKFNARRFSRSQARCWHIYC